MKNCLIIDEMHESIVPMLKKIGFSPDYKPLISRREIMDIIGSYEGLIVRSKTTLDAELIEKASNLKFIARAGAGLDKLDLEVISNKNIQVINAPEGNRDALAEHTLGLILNVLNNISFADRQIREGIWNREGNRGHELKHKTIGLIGYGFMGRAVANLLQSFGCLVIAYDKYVPEFKDPHVRSVGMEEIFNLADILSLHIPLTAETNSMVNASFLKKFKKEIFLINTARGEIVVLSDLLDAIESGLVLGAGLDVIENEKIGELDGSDKDVFKRLVKNDRIVLTPHVGGWTFESYERINQVLVDKIAKFGLS